MSGLFGVKKLFEHSLLALSNFLVVPPPRNNLGWFKIDRVSLCRDLSQFLNEETFFGVSCSFSIDKFHYRVAPHLIRHLKTGVSISPRFSNFPSPKFHIFSSSRSGTLFILNQFNDLKLLLILENTVLARNLEKGSYS